MALARSRRVRPRVLSMSRLFTRAYVPAAVLTAALVGCHHGGSGSGSHAATRPDGRVVASGTSGEITREAALGLADHEVRAKARWRPVLQYAERKPGRWEFMYCDDRNTVGRQAFVTVYDDRTVDLALGH
jgi:hypothetical protein